MRYMLLVYSDPVLEPTYGTPEFVEMMNGFAAASARMRADGVLRGADELKGVETATSLRIRSGKVVTMDGPFAETREHLGGYYVVEVADLDAALTYAALLPVAHFGTIEVRPITDHGPAD